MARNRLFDDIARTAVEVETNRRIKLAVWAYAYEFADDSIVPDEVFDHECRMVDLTINTGRPDLDAWFRKEFNPSTGVWIHKHPELNRVKDLYFKYYRNVTRAG